MTPRERRRAEVARAWAGIEAHRPKVARCRWCHSDSAYQITTAIPQPLAAPLMLPFHACEFHAIRAIEAGATIVGDVDGKRAAALIAKAAVLRVKGGGR